MTRLRIGLLLGVLATLPQARAAVELVGEGSVPGHATDRSGLTGRYTSADGASIPADQLGSFGSALCYTGAGRRYYAVHDRGFGDGATRSRDRLQVFDIAIDPARKMVAPTLIETRLLIDESGQPFHGASEPGPLRLDPEGIALGRDGSFYLSDEYGPFLYQFDARGWRIRSLPVPAKFLIAHPDPDEAREIAANTTGRVSNKGMEGLAITPDGATLVGIMQAPLIQDEGRNGRHVRILTVAVASGKTHEYVYTLESKKTGVSELLAVGGTRFLVLERDGQGGKEAFSRLFLIDLSGATDVSAVGTTAGNGLPKKHLPDSIRPVAKRLFLDLLDPRFGLATAEYPRKVEGLTWGPDLADGRRLLLVVSDNDLKPDAATRFFAFAVPRADLDD